MIHVLVSGREINVINIGEFFLVNRGLSKLGSRFNSCYYFPVYLMLTQTFSLRYQLFLLGIFCFFFWNASFPINLTQNEGELFNSGRNN